MGLPFPVGLSGLAGGKGVYGHPFPPFPSLERDGAPPDSFLVPRDRVR